MMYHHLSTKFSLNPFYLRINELPYSKRILKENTLLAGLWFGLVKLDYNYFIDSFYSEFQKLYVGDRSIYIHDINKTWNVKAVLLSGTADLPAKSAILNVTMFNGSYGCVDCE